LAAPTSPQKSGPPSRFLRPLAPPSHRSPPFPQAFSSPPPSVPILLCSACPCNYWGACSDWHGWGAAAYDVTAQLPSGLPLAPALPLHPSQGSSQGFPRRRTPQLHARSGHAHKQLADTGIKPQPRATPVPRATTGLLYLPPLMSAPLYPAASIQHLVDSVCHCQ